MTTQEVVASIDTAFDIFKGLEAKPVFFGSLIGAAVNGGFYREIGDVDLLAEKKYQNKVESYFENAGFDRYINKDIGLVAILGCCPTEFSDGARKFSFIFGNFKEHYFELPLKFGFSFRWPIKELNYEYELAGKKFSGFSPEFYSLFLIIAQKKKEKRGKDSAVISKKIDPNRLIETAEQDFIFWRGRPIPLLGKAQQLVSRWVAADALRELQSEAVRARLKSRGRFS